MVKRKLCIKTWSYLFQAIRSSNRRLSGRLVRTVSDESLHSGKPGGTFGADPREALFAERLRPDRYNQRAIYTSVPL